VGNSGRRALTVRARRDSSRRRRYRFVLLLFDRRLSPSDPRKEAGGDGDGAAAAVAGWRKAACGVRAATRTNDLAAVAGWLGRQRMMRRPRQHHRGPARWQRVPGPSDPGDGRRMGAAWLASMIDPAPPDSGLGSRSGPPLPPASAQPLCSFVLRCLYPSDTAHGLSPLFFANRTVQSIFKNENYNKIF
jgi:hypothetical protein